MRPNKGWGKTLRRNEIKRKEVGGNKKRKKEKKKERKE